MSGGQSNLATRTISNFLIPGLTEPAEGTVKDDLDVGTATALVLYSAGAFALDEIRIGTSYEHVAVPMRGALTSE